MKQYEMLEMSFPCETPEDAWAELRPEAVFTCEGETIHTEGFMPETAGARFASCL
mgnify:CR=1 FL=1